MHSGVRKRKYGEDHPGSGHPTNKSDQPEESRSVIGPLIDEASISLIYEHARSLLDHGVGALTETEKQGFDDLGKYAAKHKSELEGWKRIEMSQWKARNAKANQRPLYTSLESLNLGDPTVPVELEPEKELDRSLREGPSLPYDVWEQIFDYVVSADGETECEPQEIIAGWSHGTRAVMLSSVCHAWHRTLHSLPTLWKYIFVSLNSTVVRDVESHVHFYLRNCKQVEPLLAVQAEWFLSANRTSLLAVFSSRTESVKLARLELRLPWAYIESGLTLYSFPAPRALRMIRKPLESADSSDSSRGNPVVIPAHFFPVMRTLVVEDVVADQGYGVSDANLTLEDYRHTSRIPIKIPVPQWIKRHRLHSLRIDGTPNHLTFAPALTELINNLEVSLDTLERWVAKNICFPSLITLTLVDTEARVGGNLGVLTMNQFPSLRRLSLERSAYMDRTIILNLIDEWKGVDFLELQHDSVDIMLDAGEDTAQPLSSIKRLVIKRYKGDGNMVLNFVKNYLSWSSPLLSKNGRENSLKRIEFVECPSVSTESQRKVMQLLQGTLPVLDSDSPFTFRLPRN